ncbi:MAG: SDR family oxidoreductase, partial [Candidatus Omnitrophica bacterium]|nr:SDR family oxidoreductase [Candidatus Omnitrophota bacterium]
QTPHKAALITGGSDRIGKSIALKLAALGYDIHLHYHSSRDKAHTTAEQIKEHHVPCHLHQADLLAIEDTRKLIQECFEISPGLNLLINNASIFKPGNLLTESLDEFDANLHIHLRAPYILSKDFAAQVDTGHIINMLDTHISDHQTNHFSYLLSKKCLSALTNMMAVHLAPNIRVNAICPGIIIPPEGKEKSYAQRLANKIPLKQKGSLKEIQLSVEYLLNNTFLTGQTLFVDGGEHLI